MARVCESKENISSSVFEYDKRKPKTLNYSRRTSMYFKLPAGSAVRLAFSQHDLSGSNDARLADKKKVPAYGEGANWIDDFPRS